VFGKPQAELAVKFYKAVVGTDVSGNFAQNPYTANIALTGHSLGGGLAGYVASLYGKSAVLFDNMPFELSATLAHDAAVINDLTGYGGTRDFLYGSYDILPVDRSRITAIATEGEILSTLRFLGGQSTPVASISTEYTAILSAASELHMQDLLVNLKWSQLNGSELWKPAASSLWNAYFNLDVANSVTGISIKIGSAGAVGTLGRMIAYSAIDEGERPFGDTAVRSMFDDAGNLGRVVQLGGSGILAETIRRQSLMNIAVQYAGALALNDVEVSKVFAVDPNIDAKRGVLSLSGDEGALALDVSKKMWKDVLGVTTALTPIGLDDFRSALLAQAGITEANLTTYADEIWGASSSAVIDRLIMGTKSGSPTVKLDERSYVRGAATGNEAHIDFYIGTSANETVTGTKGGDLLVGGAGDDKIEGGEGKDVLLGGAGKDELIANFDGADDVLDGGSGSEDSVVYKYEAPLRFNEYGGGYERDRITIRLVAAPVNGTGQTAGDFGIQIQGLYGLGFGNDTLTNIEKASIEAGLQSDTLRIDMAADLSGIDYIDLGGEPEIYAFSDSSDIISLSDRTTDVVVDLSSDLVQVKQDGWAGFFGFATSLTVRGAEIVRTGSGNDRLISGNVSGKTYSLSAGAGNNFLIGKAGNDYLSGYGGYQDMSGGDGNDVLTAGSGGCTLRGDAGNDYLSSDGGISYLYGGDGDDSVSSGNGNDWLYGESGSDALNGSRGDDHLYGDSGDDQLNGGGGDDHLHGGDDDDTLTGSSGDDNLNGDAGADILFGGSGNDSLFGGENDDILYGQDDIGYNYSDLNDIDKLYGGNGNDYIYSNLGYDELYGDAGDDTLISLNPAYGTNILTGGAGSDRFTVYGFSTITDLSFEDKGVYFDYYTDQDHIVRKASGGALYDQFDYYSIYRNGTDFYRFESENSTLTISGGGAIITILNFSNGAGGIFLGNIVNGSPGDDNLNGTNGADQFSGGKGNDNLAGGKGDDFYKFSRGDGFDTVFDTGALLTLVSSTLATTAGNAQLNSAYETGGDDTIEFDDTILFTDIDVFQLSATDVALRIRSSSDQVTLKEMLNTPGAEIEHIRFADGTSWSYADVIARMIPSNRSPVYNASSTVTAAITETANLTGSANVLRSTGALKFTDPDNGDSHLVGVSSVVATGSTNSSLSNASVLSWLAFGPITEPVGATPGSSPWAFSAPDKSFDYLAAGEQLVLKYNAVLNDTAGESFTQPITVTITGTNDAPVTTIIGSQFVRRSIATRIEGIVVSDADAGSLETITLTTTRGTVTATAISGATVAGAGTKTLTVSGTVAQVNATLVSLAYTSATTGADTVTVSTSDGTANNTQVIPVTVNTTAVHAPLVLPGSNIAASFVETVGVTGSATNLTASGILLFSDADIPNTHTSTVSSVVASGVTTGLAANATVKAWLAKGTLIEPNGVTLGSAPWAFTAPDKSFDYLAVGETVTLSYVMTLADNAGGSSPQTIAVTVTGTNDGPVLTTTGTVVAGAIAERANLSGSTLLDTVSGVIKYTDADKSNAHYMQILGVTATGNIAPLPDVATMQSWLSSGAALQPIGTQGWTFAAPDSALDGLAVGEQAILTYEVRISDGQGGTLDQNIVVTITGSNDKPVATIMSGYATDNVTPLSISAATLLGSATDRDLTDTLTLTSVQGAVNGTVALVSNNAIFTPTNTKVGPASFTYTISDGKGGTSTSTVNLTTTLRRIIGTSGNDTITGTAVPAQIDGLGGNDTLNAGSGGDTLNGGDGDDILIGGAKIDTLNGGNGNDRITGGVGNDIIDGGTGTDIAVFAGLQASYSIVTSNGTTTIVDNAPTVDGNTGTDTLVGIEKAEFKGGVQIGIGAPVVLDLNGDGVRLIERTQSNATFDWDGGGTRQRTGWVDANDGILVFDRNGDGTVSGANEISFTGDKPGAKSDLDGLTAFDSNGDGQLGVGDAQWGAFKVWQDSNDNGVADAGELRSVAEAGIATISLAKIAVNRTWALGNNLTVNTGSFTRSDGTTGSLGDVALAYDVGGTQQTQTVAKVAVSDSEAPLLTQWEAGMFGGAWSRLRSSSFGVQYDVEPFELDPASWQAANQMVQAMSSFSVKGGIDEGSFKSEAMTSHEPLTVLDRNERLSIHRNGCHLV
jgi:VCBS repeat-containing protein